MNHDTGHKYDDIIFLEHPTSPTHPRMSAMDRAAQFAPFAALTGYDAMVAERSRLTGDKEDLDDMRMASLNEALGQIMEHLNEHPKVEICYFKADSKKAGGSYETLVGHVRNVELPSRKLILRDGPELLLDDIFEISVQM